ncbi:MAG: DUF5691 domain-containing protein [Myxococcales bacterium]
MSDALLRAALLGTGREPAPPADPRLETLLPESGLTAERRVLLLAGIDAVRRRAGYRPAQRTEPSRASDETRPPCSKKVAQVLGPLVAAENERLLLEAAGLLARSGQRIRPELLVSILSDIAGAEVRDAFRPLLGERGAWLSRFRAEWTWAAPAAATKVDAARAKEIWTEGSYQERVGLISRLRAEDPAAARALLESSWKEEKAENRASLIELMAVGLGADDEPFLESALDDRSAQVRAAAARLLARIEGSAFAARMEERMDAMLGSSLPVRMSLPRDIDGAWQRDGVPRNPPRGMGARVFWLVRTVALVRPRQVERRFSAAPAKIVAAAANSEESLALLQGLTEATIHFHDPAWAAALFDAWIAREGDDDSASEALSRLLGEMEQAEAEARIEASFARPSERIGLRHGLGLLRIPWSAIFSTGFVEHARRTSADPDLHAWEVAAYAVATETFPQLAAVFERPNLEPLDPYDERTLDEAREVLRIRQILHHELSGSTT